VAPDTEYGSIGIGGRDTHEEDFEQVKNGDVRIFLFGKITYEDVFKCPHWTSFCWVLNPTNPDRAKWTWDAYTVGNDATITSVRNL